MAKQDDKRALLVSVLDRLLDDDPGNSRDQPRSQNADLRGLKQSVRRDLENLLNTRWRCKSWPPELHELETSLVDYGIPDFTGINMSLPSERENLRSVMERVIRRFEPRLKNVSVAIQQNTDDFDRTLHFRINAQLRTEPAPEPVTFDSELEPLTTSIEIKTLR
jgi:type VI secretion system protein ImpF